MTTKFYNTLTKKIEDFKPIIPGLVKIYSCGPTVYNYVHIGNLRAFIFADLVRRYLKFKGFRVEHVMNVTDIDDKTIKGSQAEKRSIKEFTDFYTAEFLKDCAAIGIEKHEHMPRATDYIPSMVELIKKLIAKGHAYKTAQGDVYFKISSFQGYGEIAGISKRDLKANADGRLSNADEYDKESINDFALWKAYDEKDGDVFWETEFGKGRPGWHIECSAMSVDLLGNPFDIHTGGIDLLFPHHTNEIAQSECACGGEFVKTWMHNEHLMVNGKKMSKSLGNFYTLRDLLAKGYDAKAIRFELIKTHYRAQLDFREENLAQNSVMIRRIGDLLEALDEPRSGPGVPELKAKVQEAAQKFEAALDDDLNVSPALAAVYEIVTEANKHLPGLDGSDAAVLKEFFANVDSVFGIARKAEKLEIPAQVQKLLEARAAARAAKDFKGSDTLRDEIKKHGFTVSDGKEGQKVTKL